MGRRLEIWDKWYGHGVPILRIAYINRALDWVYHFKMDNPFSANDQNVSFISLWKGSCSGGSQVLMMTLKSSHSANCFPKIRSLPGGSFSSDKARGSLLIWRMTSQKVGDVMVKASWQKGMGNTWEYSTRRINQQRTVSSVDLSSSNW